MGKYQHAFRNWQGAGVFEFKGFLADNKFAMAPSLPSSSTMPLMRAACLFFSFVFAVGLVAAAPSARAQQTYKWIDSKGVVNYGPIPPAVDGAKKIDMSPALDLHNSACPGSNCSEESFASERARLNQERVENYQNAHRARQEQNAAAQQQRRNQLSAECERNRGTDCRNPAAQRDIENTQRPYSRRY